MPILCFMFNKIRAVFSLSFVLGDCIFDGEIPHLLGEKNRVGIWKITIIVLRYSLQWGCQMQGLQACSNPWCCFVGFRLDLHAACSMDQFRPACCMLNWPRAHAAPQGALTWCGVHTCTWHAGPVCGFDLCLSPSLWGWMSLISLLYSMEEYKLVVDGRYLHLIFHSFSKECYIHVCVCDKCYVFFIHYQLCACITWLGYL